MSIKKRKIKTKLFQQIKIFFISLIGIFVLVGIIYLTFSLVFPKRQLFISPLALQKNTNHNQIDELLQKSGIAYTSVENAQDASYLVNLKDGGQVIIAQNKNVQNQISSLQLILSRLTIEGKRFKSLDFRYDKPVVLF
jgi:hypothetical protein